eukprot:TRINITY_DN60943_c0_g1_i1.p1 TRINITY_DN60943_c0_g1~~TRINITY_DN60943_c0_g1_i1.p1  ORF type:complete len:584 (+),score=173.16 TRINITY_DN60943_c0_g1_i1:62-1753(+)
MSRSFSSSDINPFKLPAKDQILLHREQEYDRRKEERRRQKTLKVWEKTTAAAEVRRSRRVEYDDDDRVMEQAAAKTMSRSRSEPGVGRDPRREKEDVAVFVAKKRDMFLVQMSLDVKQAEILKLVEKTKQKEEALKRSQQMLDEDVARFDAFLQSNDAKARKAMQDSENMTKLKQEKMARIKLLKSQLSAHQGDISRMKERKDECLEYKQFLVNLTPQEWKDQKAEEKLERRRARKRDEVAYKMQEIRRRMNAEIDAELQAIEERPKPAKMKPEQILEREREIDSKKKRVKRKYQTEEQVEAETMEWSSEEEMPLFFEDPKQLLDVFTALEENNLFLIQGSQDTEQSLEELQQKFGKMRREADAKTGRMKQNIEVLEKQIADERARCEELHVKLSQKRGVVEQKELLAEVLMHVTEVHAATGETAEHDPDALQMLAGIEAKLEIFLAELDKAEETEEGAREVRRLEQEKDRDRWTKQHKLRLRLQEAAVEKRVKVYLERSQAPIYRKVGKQIMFRSAPLYQARRVVAEDDGLEEANREHEIFGVWINRSTGIPEADPPQREES